MGVLPDVHEALAGIANQAVQPTVLHTLFAAQHPALQNVQPNKISQTISADYSNEYHTFTERT